MQSTTTKLVIATLVAIVLLGGLLAYVLRGKPTPPPAPPVEHTATTTPVVTGPEHSVIGTSVEGRAIDEYTYGTGPTHLLFVGGMHGGYEWNAVLLAYQFKSYLDAHPDSIPKNLSVTVVPDLNPDGTFKVIGKEGPFTLADVPTNTGPIGTGRKNADNVDLNRNFDCNWQATSTWRGNPESAGTAAFSEPEAAAIRGLIDKIQPEVAVFWHSQSGTVYAAECNGTMAPKELAVMNTYANAAGYKTQATFDAYPVTGDSEGWLASIGIPALTVELTTHSVVEFDKNIAGAKALFSYFSSQDPNVAASSTDMGTGL